MIGVGQGKLGEQPSVGSEKQLEPLILSLLCARLSVQLASSFSQPFDVSTREERTWHKVEHLSGEWQLSQGHGCFCVGSAPSEQSRKRDKVASVHACVCLCTCICVCMHMCVFMCVRVCKVALITLRKPIPCSSKVLDRHACKYSKAHKFRRSGIHTKF